MGTSLPEVFVGCRILGATPRWSESLGVQKRKSLRMRWAWGVGRVEESICPSRAAWEESDEEEDLPVTTPSKFDDGRVTVPPQSGCQ